MVADQAHKTVGLRAPIRVIAAAVLFLVTAVAANQRSAAGAFAEAIRSFLRGAAPSVPDTAPPPQHWGQHFGSGTGDLERSTAS